MSIIIANSSSIDYSKVLENAFFREASATLITEKASLRLDYINSLLEKPRYIFFPHWSYIIPKEIYKNFNCVIFHMTDLPFGRGGSPLQNLIKRKITKTKISAIRCVKEIDAGAVYLKEDLDLSGTAQEIYTRASFIIVDMMKKIISSDIEPMEQVGEVIKFERRKPCQSEIKDINCTEELYDHIRMLDADGYPKAFIKKSGFYYEFSDAVLGDDNQLSARVKIKKVQHDE